jgi:hypothetical protein
MTELPAQVWIITEVSTTETIEVPRGERSGDDIGGGYNPPRTPRLTTATTTKRVALDALALKAQMRGLLDVVGEVFDQANQQTGLSLDQVELAVEINAEGQVSILGTGGKLGDRGAIKLTFKRSPSN